MLTVSTSFKGGACLLFLSYLREEVEHRASAHKGGDGEVDVHRQPALHRGQRLRVPYPRLRRPADVARPRVCHLRVAVDAQALAWSKLGRSLMRQEGGRRGAGGGQERFRRGSGGGQEGKYRSSVDAHEPQNPT
eukprot:1175760-Prorocentrum_minimum.AAC.1